MVELVRCGYGREAAEALHRAIATAKGGEPLAPVTVVVPSNHVGVASRRHLASGALGPVAGTGTGLAAVTFVTTYRLAELLGAPRLAAAGKRPVSTPVLAAAMRQALAADAGLFEPVKAHPATESALVASYKELRDLAPGPLDALASSSGRAAEVVRLHRAVREQLEGRWYDEEDLLGAASAAVAADGAHEVGPLVVHLPQRLTRHGAGFLRSLAARTPTTVVAGLTGVPGADAEVQRSLRRLGLDAEQPPFAPRPPDRAPTSIVTTSDADEEVRHAVRAVVEAVRSGTRLDQVAVLHAAPEPYARLAHEQLQAAGIATNGAAVLPLSARIAGRTLLELLALPAAGFRRQDVLAWLTAAPVLHEGRWAPTAAWERISREAAVVGGRDDWDRLLLRYAEAAERRADALAADAEAADWRVEEERAQARRARDLRAFVLGLVDDLAGADRRRPWSEHATWARRTLRRLLGAEHRQDRWPDAERKAAERVDEALHRLGALDEVEGPVGLDVFARTLEVELEHDLGRVGRFGDGVLVGSVEMGIGLDLELVVVLGMAEGSFPTTVRDDSLLPDAERRAAGDELPLRAERVGRQHRQLLAALAGARQRLLCVPRGDLRRSAERVPSRWVLELAAELDGGVRRWWAHDLLHGRAPWLRHVASFDGGLRDLTVPATEQEHRLRALLAGGGDLTQIDDPPTALGAELLRGRRSSRFTRFDGNLAGLPIPSPLDRPTSPTRLERWAGCPHAHLVQDLLHAGPVENPEEALMITPIDRGNLVHAALERFLLEVLARPVEQRPPAGRAWTEADRARLEAIGSELCAEYEALGLTGRPLYWRRDRRRILDDLDDFLVHDSLARARSRTSPLAVELGFGLPDGDPPVGLALPDGRRLEIRGKADRIDLAEDGTIHVIDYKTGKPDPYAGLSEENPVMAGTRLQLPVYGLAGRQHRGHPDAAVRAEYWFVTARGEFKRAGYQVTDEVLQATTATIAEIVEGIEAGVFPHRPEPGRSTHIFVDCEVCDPDGLGTVDLRRQWERKRSDPALARYAQLAEPGEPAESTAPAASPERPAAVEAAVPA